MSAVRQSSSFNSSAASSQISHLEGHDDMEITRVKHFVKDLLKARIFLGQYIERRLIDQRIGYRDVVLVSAAEYELKRDLSDSQQRLRMVSRNIHWIGIIESEALGISPSGICICTEIENQPFGPFWFQIKSLKFRDDEFMLTLKCIRYISDAFLEIEPILTGGGLKTISKTAVAKPDSSSGTTVNDAYNDIITTCKSVLTIGNLKEFLTFVVAFILAVFTGSTAFISFLGNFILALLRELSIVIKNSTPGFLGLLDFFSKIVGGFYILLAMFFKPKPPPPPTYYPRSLAYPSQHFQHKSNEFHHDGKID